MQQLEYFMAASDLHASDH